MKEDKPSISWTEKPPSSVVPVTKERVFPTLDNTNDFWKSVNLELHQFYQKGAIVAKGNSLPDQDYEKVLDVVTVCIFECIRDSVNSGEFELEERQEKLEQISSVEAIFKSAIQVLKSLKIKLDSNSVLCILQGCINESALQLSKKYEGRFRT